MTKRRRETGQGECKLTLKPCTFVKCHILPRALTKPAIRGRSLIQVGNGFPPTRRWSSWYDTQLVGAEGEDILSRHDDTGIRELRRQKLVWSGWGNAQSLPEKIDYFDGERGMRSVANPDSSALRTFLLSVLWRAAASNLPEFSEVFLDSDELEKLRRVVLALNPEPPRYFPMRLTQISTRGEVHNHGPILDVLDMRYGDNRVPASEVTFRFYFDGLIVHVLRDAVSTSYFEIMGPSALGQFNRLAVATVSWSASRQMENLKSIKSGYGQD